MSIGDWPWIIALLLIGSWIGSWLTLEVEDDQSMDQFARISVATAMPFIGIAILAYRTWRNKQ